MTPDCTTAPAAQPHPIRKVLRPVLYQSELRKTYDRHLPPVRGTWPAFVLLPRLAVTNATLLLRIMQALPAAEIVSTDFLLRFRALTIQFRSETARATWCGSGIPVDADHTIPCVVPPPPSRS